MKAIIGVLLMLMLSSSLAFAAQFYASDFETDTIGEPPAGWEIGFEGNGEGAVIKDPLNAGNKVFAHTDLAFDQARHDVEGVIWTVGEEDWKNYIVEYDAYFPDDFYMGTLVRFQNDAAFYLFDRRVGGGPAAPTFDFWKNDGGWVNFASAGAFGAAPEEWYKFRLVVEDDNFQAFAKEMDDNTPFAEMEPILEGTDGAYETGKFALYGLIYVDNVVIGETEDDLTIAIEPAGKLATTWGDMKR